MTCPTAIFNKVLPIFLLSLLMILKMFLPVNQKISLQQSKKLKKMFPQANFILEQRTNESIENANQNNDNSLHDFRMFSLLPNDGG